MAWEWQPAVNAVGRLLCAWNPNNFQVDFHFSDKDFIKLGGVWLPDMQRLVVVNIYAPCDLLGKRQFWHNLRSKKIQSQDTCWCLIGDFNCIRHPTERMGCNRSSSDTSIIDEFNEWIAELEVDDIPCIGKSFTWVRPNGTCKSKLDRVLVTDGWLDKWPDSFQCNLERNYSDHCPIIMKSKSIDWGPKPFKVFYAWLKNKEYQKVAFL